MINRIKRLLNRNKNNDTMDDIVYRINQFRVCGWNLPDGFKVKKKLNEYEPMLMWIEDYYYNGMLVLSVEYIMGKSTILKFKGGEWVNIVNEAYHNSIGIGKVPPPRNPPSGTKIIKWERDIELWIT